MMNSNNRIYGQILSAQGSSAKKFDHFQFLSSDCLQNMPILNTCKLLFFSRIISDV